MSNAALTNIRMIERAQKTLVEQITRFAAIAESNPPSYSSIKLSDMAAPSRIRHDSFMQETGQPNLVGQIGTSYISVDGAFFNVVDDFFACRRNVRLLENKLQKGFRPLPAPRAAVTPAQQRTMRRTVWGSHLPFATMRTVTSWEPVIQNSTRGSSTLSSRRQEPAAQHSIEVVFPSWLSTRRVHATLTASLFSVRLANVIPYDAAIFQACERTDTQSVRHLITSGQASPFDVDPDGKGLLHYATMCANVIPGESEDLVRYLMSCGIDGASGFEALVHHFFWIQATYTHEMSIWFDTNQEYVECENLQDVGRVIVRQMQEAGFGDSIPDNMSLEQCGLEFIEQTGNALDDLQKQRECFSDIGRLCFENAQSDPLESPGVRWDLFNQLGSGSCAIALDSFYLYQESWPFLEDLLHDQPDRVLDALLQTHCCRTYNMRFDEDIQSQLDHRYEFLAYILSSPARDVLFAALRSPGTEANLSRYHCPSRASHAVLNLLQGTRPECCFRDRRLMMQKHLRRMLELLLSAGEDLTMLCPCERAWAHGGAESRSGVCVAAEKGFLDVLKGAAAATDPRMLDAVTAWTLAGVSQLFDEHEDESGDTTAPNSQCYCCSSLDVSAVVTAEGTLGHDKAMLGSAQWVSKLVISTLSSVV